MDSSFSGTSSAAQHEQWRRFGGYFVPGMSANPTITGNLLIHTFHCRLKSHSWKRFWDYDTFVV